MIFWYSSYPSLSSFSTLSCSFLIRSISSEISSLMISRSSTWCFSYNSERCFLILGSSLRRVIWVLRYKAAAISLRCLCLIEFFSSVTRVKDRFYTMAGHSLSPLFPHSLLSLRSRLLRVELRLMSLTSPSTASSSISHELKSKWSRLLFLVMASARALAPSLRTEFCSRMRVYKVVFSARP